MVKPLQASVAKEHTINTIISEIVAGRLQGKKLDTLLENRNLGFVINSRLDKLVSHELENGEEKNALLAMRKYSHLQKIAEDVVKLNSAPVSAINSEYLMALSHEAVCKVLFAIDPNVPENADGPGAPKRNRDPNKFEAILKEGGCLRDIIRKKCEEEEKDGLGSGIRKTQIIGAYVGYYAEQMAIIEPTQNPLSRINIGVLKRMANEDWAEATKPLMKFAEQEKTRHVFDAFIKAAKDNNKVDAVVKAVASEIFNHYFGRVEDKTSVSFSRFFSGSDEYMINNLKTATNIVPILQGLFREALIGEEYWPKIENKKRGSPYISVYREGEDEQSFFFNEGDRIKIKLEKSARCFEEGRVDHYSVFVTIKKNRDIEDNETIKPVTEQRMKYTLDEKKRPTFEVDLAGNVTDIFYAQIEIVPYKHEMVKEEGKQERVVEVRGREIKMTVLVIPKGEEFALNPEKAEDIIRDVRRGHFSTKEAAEALNRMDYFSRDAALTRSIIDKMSRKGDTLAAAAYQVLEEFQKINAY